jgi:hypothetical protein
VHATTSTSKFLKSTAADEVLSESQFQFEVKLASRSKSKGVGPSASTHVFPPPCLVISYIIPKLQEAHPSTKVDF